jgi:SAM-dependent methyltransferase
MFVVFQYALFRRDIYKAPGSELLDVVSHAPRFNRWMADTVRPFLGDRVLEIGAGIGNLSNLLYQHKKRYVASDVDPEHLAGMRAKAQHRRNFEALYLNLERAEDFVPHSASFDSVVCLNVLEHIADDIQGLRNIFQCLRPGGTAVVLVPEGMSVFGTLDEVLEHVRRYSEPELRSKLERVGFKVEQMLRFNRITRPAWYVNGRILKRRTLYRVPMFVFDRFVWLWRLLDPWLPWKPTSLIAVAVRPE